MSYTGRVDLSKATKEELLALINRASHRWFLAEFQENLERELHLMREDQLLSRMKEIVSLLPKAASHEEWLKLQDEFTAVDKKLSKLQGA